MAEKTEFLQAIDDAILDADSLEKFINGSDSETVLTRLSAEYPTLRKALKELFESGGLPATPFETTANMESSDIADGGYAIVTDDNDDANGLYVKKDGQWIKSKYDAYRYLLDKLESELEPHKKEYQDINDWLFIKKDKLDNVIEYTDNEGGLYLTGLDGSVQNNLNAVSGSLSSFDGAIAYSNSEPVYTFKDADNNTVATINNDGGLYVGGLYGSVQDNIKLLQRDIDGIYNILKQKELKGVVGFKPDSYTANASEMLAATAQAGTVQTLHLDSPYNRDDHFVHPDVIELVEPLRGYKYLMCINPYYNAALIRENPVIYGSNDKINWEMLRGFYQPLDEPPQLKQPNSPRDGYLSDNWFTYDPINKELLCCYRYNTSEKGVLYGWNDTVELFYRKTKDGLNWSDRTQLCPQTTMNIDRMISPVMFYDESITKWVLMYHRSNGMGIVVMFNDTLDPDTWSEPVSTGITEFYANAGGLSLWHMGGKFIGKDYYLMLGIVDEDNKNYPVFAKCNDNTYTNWTCSAKNVFGGVDKGIYKGAFLPEFVGGGIRLRYYWTEMFAHLLTATSNTISITQ